MRLMFIIVVILICACPHHISQASNSWTEKNAKPSRKTNIVIGVQGEAGPFDHAISPAKEQTLIVQPAYEQLITIAIDGNTGRSSHIPMLAEAWVVTGGGTQWTFKIAEGHYFNDGSEVSAVDVKFTFDRMLALNGTPRKILFDYLLSTELIDKRTIKFTLSKPSNRFLSALADDAGSIVNHRIIKHEINEDWASKWLSVNTAGSGPFYLSGINQDTYTLKQNSFYKINNRPPHELIFKVIDNQSDRALALKIKEIDVAINLSATYASDFLDNSSMQVLSAPAPVFLNVALNNESAVFRDINMRRAFAHMINYNSVIEVIREGWELPFKGPIPEGTLGYSKNQYDYNYAPDFAKALVAKSEVDLSNKLLFIYPSSSTDEDKVVRYLKLQLRALGFSVEAVRYSTSEFLTALDEGKYDLALVGTVLTGREPSVYLNSWFLPSKIGAAGNTARYNNEKVTRLLSQIEMELSEQARRPLIADAIKIINQDLPYLYLFQRKLPIVVNKQVGKFERGYEKLEKNNFLFVEKITEEKN